MITLPHPGQSLEDAKKELEDVLKTNQEKCYMFVGSEVIAQKAQAEAERAPNRDVVWLQTPGVVDSPQSSSGEIIVAWTLTDALNGERRDCRKLKVTQASSPSELQQAFLRTQLYDCDTI